MAPLALSLGNRLEKTVKLSSNYTDEYNRALSTLKKLEIDKALSMFYRLLKSHPINYPLIRQIYQLELGKADSLGIKKIAHHLFSQTDMSEEFHTIIISCYKELKQRFGMEYFNALDYQRVLNLFYHLGQTNFQDDLDTLLQRLKSENPEHPALAPALFIYCEQLIAKNKFLKAKSELEYLMIYYTEAETQTVAEKLFKRVTAGIRL